MLNFLLPLIALLTRPKSWIMTSVAFLILCLIKFLAEGQSIFFKHWIEIYNGFLNPLVPVEQKILIVSLFILITTLGFYYADMLRKVYIFQDKRFGKK